MSNIFTDEAWEHYIEWQLKDKDTIQKINELIKDINRNGLAKRNRKTRTIKTQKRLESQNKSRT